MIPCRRCWMELALDSGRKRIASPEVSWGFVLGISVCARAEQRVGAATTATDRLRVHWRLQGGRSELADGMDLQFLEKRVTNKKYQG